MLLTRDNVVGYDAARMMFVFTMMTPDVRAMTCEISGVLWTRLLEKSAAPPSERKLQFATLRDKIERAASEIFDKSDLVRIQTFAMHVSLSRGSE